MNAPPPAPTERELEILKILWDRGPSSVRDVYDIMNAAEPPPGLAQNTVQTFLRMMEDKGLVAHTLEGRSFIYRPLYSRKKPSPASSTASSTAPSTSSS